MADVLALINDYILPVVGCLWAGTVVYDRGGSFILWGMFAFYHPISGVVLALLVGKRCFCCRAKISYEATVCTQCGMLMPEIQVRTRRQINPEVASSNRDLHQVDR